MLLLFRDCCCCKVPDLSQALWRWMFQAASGGKTGICWSLPRRTRPCRRHSFEVDGSAASVFTTPLQRTGFAAAHAKSAGGRCGASPSNGGSRPMVVSAVSDAICWMRRVRLVIMAPPPDVRWLRRESGCGAIRYFPPFSS